MFEWLGDINSHFVWTAHESWENSCANSHFSTLIYSHPRLTGAWELRELSCKLSLLNSHQLSYNLVWPAHETWENSRANSRFSTLINSHTTSFDWRMRAERTLVQTLASQLSSTLILVWPAHESWENSVQTLTSQLSSSFDHAFRSKALCFNNILNAFRWKFLQYKR